MVKVLDFGIAKVKDASAHTQTGAVKGKYAYMSPEQLRGAAVDRRADVFALGVVVYETFARSCALDPTWAAGADSAAT